MEELKIDSIIKFLKLTLFFAAVDWIFHSKSFEDFLWKTCCGGKYYFPPSRICGAKPGVHENFVFCPARIHEVKPLESQSAIK
jgi:hypothetical protein